LDRDSVAPEILMKRRQSRDHVAHSMLPQLRRDAYGGITILIQNESSGKDSEANWLPAPKGPFSMYMPLY
jgi:hypothetical protein